MQVEVASNATGEVGFLNEGWWGMNVEAEITYHACEAL